MDVSSIRVSFSAVCRVSADGGPLEVLEQSPPKWHCEEHGTAWRDWGDVCEHLSTVHGEEIGSDYPPIQGSVETIGVMENVGISLEPPTGEGEQS